MPARVVIPSIVLALLASPCSWAADSPCVAMIDLSSRNVDQATELSAELEFPPGTPLFRARGTPLNFVVVRPRPERTTDASKLVERKTDPKKDAPDGWWKIPEQAGLPTEVDWSRVQEPVNDDEIIVPPGEYRLRYTYAVALPDAEPPVPAVLCTVYSRVFVVRSRTTWFVIQ